MRKVVIAVMATITLAVAPVASAAPNGSAEHCTHLKKEIDSFGPHDDGPSVHHAFAQYQIHCLGSALPSVGSVKPGFIDVVLPRPNDPPVFHYHPHPIPPPRHPDLP
jgi:hypothetical protein